MESLGIVMALGLGLLLALGVLLVRMGMPRGPSLIQVQHLRTPHLVDMAPQKVLQVRARGNPNVVGKDAFGLLMKTYFRLKGVPRGGPSFRAPRARWPVELETPPEEWEGLYAMPVPEWVEYVPRPSRTPCGLTVEVTTWEYGPVAQVLHVGRWDQERSTVEELTTFARSRGYDLVGPHEEEYLKGPGFLFMGDPNRYLTMIRSRVAPSLPIGGAPS